MTKMITKIAGAFVGVFIASSAFAQTAGTLTFSYSPVSHSGYSGTKNVLAVWIQSGTGAFVKTKIRRAGGGTSDHLPTWAVNSGGSAGNCLSSSCNTVSASTGATLSSFTPQSITWDGTDVNGNVVADGTYKVTIQSTWNHGGSGTTTRSFTFTKGASADVQTPAADANFTNIALAWNPSGSGAGVEENSADMAVSIYPNPSTDGLFTVEYDKATNVKVVDVSGTVVAEQELTANSGSQVLDLSAFTNGIYFVFVYDGTKSSKHKVVLNK